MDKERLNKLSLFRLKIKWVGLGGGLIPVCEYLIRGYRFGGVRLFLLMQAVD